MSALHETLVDLANTRDAHGQSLFSGSRQILTLLFEIWMEPFPIMVTAGSHSSGL